MPTPTSPASSITRATSNSSSAAARIILRLAGVRHTELADGQRGEKIVWIVRRMEIDFLRSARMDDVLTIDTRTERISGARIFMAQEIRRGDETARGREGRSRDHRRDRPAEALPERMDRGLHAAGASSRSSRLDIARSLPMARPRIAALCPNPSLTITVHEEDW